MDDLFFGQFLVGEEIVTGVELLQAVAYQKGRNRLLGELAVDLKLLTKEQVERAKLLQRDRDILFGDAVVWLGYLSQNQLEDLLKIQKQTRVFIGEVIIKLGFATEEVVQKALQKFEAQYRSNQLVPFSFEGAYQVWFDPIIASAQKTLTRAYGVPSRLGIHDTFTKGAEIPLFRWSASCNVTRPWEGGLIFSASERVISNIMRRGIASDRLENSDVALSKTVKEVASLICRLSKASIDLELKGEPLQIEQRTLALGPNRGVVAELITPLGAAHIALTFK